MTGIVNIYKPKGITSHTVVAMVRRITGIKKVGHGGTLDPLATGVLPICIGREATKLSDLIMLGDKGYQATMKLGESTTTQDSEGEIIKESDILVTREQFEQTLEEFIGDISQVPPMYSAVKIGGKKLYELARKGIEIERKARNITVFSIRLLDFLSPYASIDVSCTKGTYIRTLCHDIGERLGVGAHVTALERTKCGRFDLSSCVTMEQFEDLWNKEKWDEFLFAPESITAGGQC